MNAIFGKFYALNSLSKDFKILIALKLQEYEGETFCVSYYYHALVFM